MLCYTKGIMDTNQKQTTKYELHNAMQHSLGSEADDCLHQLWTDYRDLKRRTLKYSEMISQMIGYRITQTSATSYGIAKLLGISVNAVNNRVGKYKQRNRR